MNNPLTRFKWVAFLEGTSFLILLFVCVPLRYGLGILWPNKVMGMAHGWIVECTSDDRTPTPPVTAGQLAEAINTCSAPAVRGSMRRWLNCLRLGAHRVGSRGGTGNRAAAGPAIIISAAKVIGVGRNVDARRGMNELLL